MWEHRIFWDSAPPSWWSEVWTSARAALQRQHRTPEDRPDTYLVLGDRPDVGLKLRGAQGEFEIKVRHQVRDGWELWEKVPFFAWNDLEAARLAALLRCRPTARHIDARATPVAGATALLDGNGVVWREIRIDKTRMQARAGDLLPALSSRVVDPDWIAEIVQFHTGTAIARSICYEAMIPGAGALPDSAGGRPAGYPEFLIGLARG